MNTFSLIDLFLIAITITVAVLFINKPRTGLIMFFLAKFTTDLFWDNRLLNCNVNILQIHGILFIVFCVVLFIHYKKHIAHHPMKNILIALFISNVVASVWGYVNSHFTFFALVASPLSIEHIIEWNLRFLNLAGTFVIVPFIFNLKNDFRLLVKVFTFATFIPVILGLNDFVQQLLIGHNLTEEIGYSVQFFPRLTAGYHDSAVFAIVLFTGALGSFYLFYTEITKKFKCVFFVYFLITVFLLYNTYSRTIWLTAAFFFILFFLYQKKYIPAIIVFIIIISAVISIPSVQKRFRQEISYIKQNNTEIIQIEKTGTGRIGLWKIAADHYRRLDFVSKLIGSGGAYGSHNQFIAFLLKNGFIGIALLFLFIFQLHKRLMQTKKSILNDTLPSFALVLGLLVSSVFIANQFIQLWEHITYNYFFWGITGILIQHSEE